MVFSCRVKGCFNSPNLLSSAVHDLRTANPNKPAATLRDGITPVVRLSLQTMKLKTRLKMKLVTAARSVIYFRHDGTGLSLKASSITTLESMGLPPPPPPSASAPTGRISRS
ncbi:hypothetical protein SLE2022_141910 [Rubroshorea leprosula]